MPRILVVEDDPDQLEMRKLILEHAGYEVVAAQNAAQAIERLPGCRLVVMDLRLPAPEDGLRLIEAASGSARIVVLSGDAETALPVDEFLTKPCSSKKLLETIARFCVLLIALCAGLRAGSFTVSKTSESVAELDGEPQQQAMLYAGADSITRFSLERSRPANIGWAIAAKAGN